MPHAGTISTLWNVVSATGQSLQLTACHYRKQPRGIQVAMNLERDSLVFVDGRIGRGGSVAGVAQ